LFVFNKEKSDIGKVFSKGEGSSEYIYQSQDSKLNKSESILRSSISRSIGLGQSLELGGEIAINKFNRNFQNNTRSAKGEALLLKNDDDVKIKENRYEVFANHSYSISPQISLQSSITAEFSKIVADNFFADGSMDRREANFTFLKPRMNFRYDLTGRDQLRFTAERTVSQLDFNNFATSYNALTEKIDFGNTAIKPAKSWDLTAAFEHRLLDDNGSVSLEVFYKKFTDHIDKVDFTEYVDNLGNPISADAYFALSSDLQTLISSDFNAKFGNIDSAKSIGFRFKSSYRLGAIGLKEAVFSFNYEYDKSTYIDTFTKNVVPFSFKSLKNIYFGYRHDVSSLNLSYGGSVNFRKGFYVNDIRLIWAGRPGTLIDLFVEKNIFNGIKLRISAKELTKEASVSIQRIYNKHSRFDDLNYKNNRGSFTARVIEATLQGTF
jgi:outer membrane receptor for ferrienterochelin and colicins